MSGTPIIATLESRMALDGGDLKENKATLGDEGTVIRLITDYRDVICSY